MQPHNTTNEIPYGYCHCGCGRKTNIATHTNIKRGSVKGKPVRYISGHNARKHFPEPEPKYCECGCGELTPIAKVTNPARGAIRGEHQRFVAGHSSRLRAPRPMSERFWEKVDVRGPDECWEWQAHAGTQRRGSFMVGSKRDGTHRLVMAHRIAYELHYGSIPEGMEVCHKCDNPPCCNPAHLFIGTHKENMEDMATKGRSSQGERDSQAILTAEQVREIRAHRASGMMYKDIAKLYNVSKAAIGAIARRDRWKHID